MNREKCRILCQLSWSIDILWFAGHINSIRPTNEILSRLTSLLLKPDQVQLNSQSINEIGKR